MATPSDGRGVETDLPDHVAETVEDLAALHEANRSNLGKTENAFRFVTRQAGRPIALASFLALVTMWMVGNTVAYRLGFAIDAPPFIYLDLAAALIGVSLTILILVTQQRDDALAERREQMTLELAMIADRKSAKIIQLLEELRCDLPGVGNRDDGEADAMAKPNAPHKILDAIKKSHGQTASGAAEPSE